MKRRDTLAGFSCFNAEIIENISVRLLNINLLNMLWSDETTVTVNVSHRKINVHTDTSV